MMAPMLLSPIRSGALGRAALTGLALVAAACGTKEPDWAFLSQVTIPSTLTCGRDLDGASLVHLAYEGNPFAGLPDPEPLPDDARSAADDLGSLHHTFPCASSAATARADLEAAGYTDLALASESPRAFVFTGKDRVGIEGRYVRFSCAWVSDLRQDLDPPPPWSVLTAGIDGTFAQVPAPSDALQALSDLAAITFRARLMQPVPTLSAYPLRDAVFVGMGDALVTGPFPSENDPVRSVLPFCATWVEHDVYDGCDRIYLGVSFHLLLDESPGLFHQSVLVRQSLLAGDTERGLTGFCRR
jgi:hypothetical protein